MSSTYRSRSRDERIADDSSVSLQLMCKVDGCPNRWSYAEGLIGEGIRGICSAHHAAPSHEWEAVTQHEQFASYERARQAAMPKPAPRFINRDERLAVLQRLKAGILGANEPGRAWAYRLKEREEAGEKLTRAQQQTWRQALEGRLVTEAE